MVHVFISGRVQGIGFRQFIKSKANRLNLRGWVRNLPDGRVEGMFAGERKNIEEILDYCRKGPFLADVRKIEVDWNSKIKVDTMEFEIIQ